MKIDDILNDLKTIKVTIVRGVATLRLSRPEAMNAIDQNMRRELKIAIEGLETDDRIRVVVIRGEGPCFSSGTDLSEGLVGYDTIDALIQDEYRPLLMAIGSSRKPYVASIHGACVGIGAALAMACDLAIMSEKSYLYLAFAGLSLVPDGGLSHVLVRSLGYKRAYQMFTESAKILSADCLRYGLVNKVCADADLEQETITWAERLAAGAPLSHRYGKQIMRAAEQGSFQEILDMESRLQVVCSTSEDSRAAVGAFFEKRKPVFTGC